METFSIAQHYDVIITVANRVELYVSSQILLDTGVPLWVDAFCEGSKEGDNSVARRNQYPDLPYQMRLEDEDPSGMMRYCAAFHERHDLITAGLDFASLLSFAMVVDKYGGIARLVNTTNSAMDAFPIEAISKQPALLLRCAVSFEHAERFSQITDHISK